ncbi:hypothetical protein C5167_019757, partial [Papaver somniferum]
IQLHQEILQTAFKIANFTSSDSTSGYAAVPIPNTGITLPEFNVTPAHQNREMEEKISNYL